MELARSIAQQNYIKQVKEVEVEIEEATDSGVNRGLLDEAQKKLDTLAAKYQHNDKIGSAIYKLYELQAMVHYFNGNDADALDFINQAVETRGSNYARAEKLKMQLSEAARLSIAPEKGSSKTKKHKALVGVSGWLAWYVVGLFISTLVTIFNFFSSGVSMSSSDVDNLNQYQVGLGSTFQTLVTSENVAQLVYVALLVWAIFLIFRRKKFAKGIAIAGLVFGAVYTIADYSIASSLFTSANLTQYVQPELNQAAGYAGRNLLGALIWIPYFLVSKRVRATLTE